MKHVYFVSYYATTRYVRSGEARGNISITREGPLDDISKIREVEDDIKNSINAVSEGASFVINQITITNFKLLRIEPRDEGMVLSSLEQMVGKTVKSVDEYDVHWEDAIEIRFTDGSVIYIECGNAGGYGQISVNQGRSEE